MNDTLNDTELLTDIDWEDESAYQERRRKRQERIKLEKEKQEQRRKIIKLVATCAGAALVAIPLLITATNAFASDKKKESTSYKAPRYAFVRQDTVGKNTDYDNITASADTGGTPVIPDTVLPDNPPEAEPVQPVQTSSERYEAMLSEATGQPGDKVISGYAVVVDADSGAILSAKEGMTRINPASMTKILTILVAAEHITNLDDTFTITREITDYSYSNDCSAVGFAVDEVVTVRDLFFGTILPSGGDAAAALAIYTAGSLDAFAELMNEKLAELGLSETSHMTNCVGLYNKEHYSTVYDMALILQAAIENDICREALTAHTYTTSATTEHPEGITISNWFLRRIEDRETNGEVLYAKTGFVNQSGSCAASYELGNDGKGYICVTAGSSSSWQCIYDQVELYLQCVSE